VFRFGLEENITNLAIVGIYVVVTFLGAFVTGKCIGERKFLWGLLLGVLYICIISLVAIVVGHTFHVADTADLTTALLCIGGGLLGGMLS
jgi:putative membrane protein (TIGR04086 family)